MNEMHLFSWSECVVVLLMVSVVSPAHALLGIPDFLEYGNCANVTLKTDYDPVKYSGLWFDIESVPNEYQHTKMCVTQHYTWAGTHMDVATRGLTKEKRKVQQGAVMHVETDALIDPHPAYMTVVASGVPEAPYQIVATDYWTYSCVYSCLEYFGFRAEFAWVFGRTPTLPTTTVDRCHLAFANMGVDPTKMVPILQGEACPYYDKLEAMLANSEQHLLELLGPPSTSPPHKEHLLELLGPPSASPPHKERALDESLESLQDLEGGTAPGLANPRLASQREVSGAERPTSNRSSGTNCGHLFISLSLLLLMVDVPN